MHTVLKEMPRYRSHKEVRALKLREVRPDDVPGHTRFVPDDPEQVPHVYGNDSEVVKRCLAVEMGDPGYLVVYPDGFMSWSPTQAFEDGYTRLP